MQTSFAVVVSGFGLNVRQRTYSWCLRQTNGYMLAEYMQEERRGSALERTPNKREQKRPNEQWGLKSIYGMPTSHLLSNPL